MNAPAQAGSAGSCSNASSAGSAVSAIGGYFGLALPAGAGPRYPQAQAFQSARAAALALLLAVKPARAWLPHYLCDSMVEPFRMADIPVFRYAVDARFNVADGLALAPGDVLVYVNYFGLCDAAVARVLARFAPAQVIIDNTQAFYAAPSECLATIYSPRKFHGVPDGGYLVTAAAVATPHEVDEGSVERSIHLLKRLGDGPEPGYADYGRAEASIAGQAPKRMSALTGALLAAIDYPAVMASRRANHALLAAAFDATNTLALPLPANAVPMCYPYLPASGAVAATRAALVAQRIYLPAYWPEVQADPAAPAFEKRLAADTLFLPCDQRLSAPDLARLIAAVRLREGADDA